LKKISSLLTYLKHSQLQLVKFLISQRVKLGLFFPFIRIFYCDSPENSQNGLYAVKKTGNVCQRNKGNV